MANLKDLIVTGNSTLTGNVSVNNINGVAVGNSPKFTDTQSDWNQTDTEADDYIKNKPSVYTQQQTDEAIEQAKEDVSWKVGFYGAVNGVVTIEPRSNVIYTPMSSLNVSQLDIALRSDNFNVGDSFVIFVTAGEDKEGVDFVQTLTPSTETHTPNIINRPYLFKEGMTYKVTYTLVRKSVKNYTWKEVWVGGTATVAYTGSYNDLSDKPNIPTVPTNVSDFTNDAGYITKSVNDLVNYYLKSETYTKTEVQTLINAVKQFTYEVVQTLPTATAGTMNKIYLVPSSDPQTSNIKDEYITIDNGSEATTRYTWEKIGSTDVDLSGYSTTEEMNAAIQMALASCAVPDEEDLTSVTVDGTDVIRFKDKTYNAELYSGLGRVYLRKNMVNGVNTLTQSMMQAANTIYIIQYDYDLANATITIPTNCILKFNGGSLSNGTLRVDYSNVIIQGPVGFENVKILVNNTNCHILDIDIVNESQQCIYSNSANGCSGLTIKNCKLISTGSDCIKVIADNDVEHIQNITIEGCDIQFYRMGIEFQSHAENSSFIENCIISNNKIKLYDPASYQYGYGISLSGFGNNVLVEKNEISSCQSGIENPGFTGTRIINNAISNIAGKILDFSNRDSNKAYISGNVFNTGQIFISRGIGTFFTNNECYVSEVRFEVSSNCKIIGNNIITYGGYGIFFDNTGGSYIDNNYIYTSSRAGSVIHFYGESSTNNRILNCHLLRSNTDYGDIIQNASGATGNIIYSYINENSKSIYSPELTTIKNSITSIDTTVVNNTTYQPLNANHIRNFYFAINSSEEIVFSIRVPKQNSVHFMFHVFAHHGNDNTNSGAYEFIIDRVAYSASDAGVSLKRIRNIPNIRYEYSSDNDYCYFNVILVGTSGNRGLKLYVLEGISNRDNVHINLTGRTAVYTKEKEESGTSEQRPTNVPNYYEYFDTTLGKPIWRKGNSWVDTLGRVVSNTPLSEGDEVATMADLPTTMGASGSGHKGGLVPDTPSTAGTTKFLREDGTWEVPSYTTNTTYKLKIGSTTNGDTTNGVSLGVLESKAAAANGTDLSLVTTGEKNTWNSKQNALVFNTAYNASTNKVATMADVTTITFKQW